MPDQGAVYICERRGVVHRDPYLEFCRCRLRTVSTLCAQHLASGGLQALSPRTQRLLSCNIIATLASVVIVRSVESVYDDGQRTRGDAGGRSWPQWQTQGLHPRTRTAC
jgi:hypothetical protein